MNEKTDVQVIINDKRYTISGYESSDYLQHIANYINEKLQTFKKQDAYNHLDMDMKNILLAINLSDDYFKAQKLAEENKQQQGEVEQEMFRMKHEIVSRDEEMKALKEQLKEVQDKAAELEKKNIRMETEIEQKTEEIEHKNKELEKKTKEIEEKNKELQRRAVMPAAQQVAAPVYKTPVSPARVPQPAASVVSQNGQRPVSSVTVTQNGQQSAAAASVTQSKSQQVPASTVSQQGASHKSTGGSTAVSGNQPTGQNAAATSEKPAEDALMSGIQPVKAEKKEEKQPSIPAFDLEPDPGESNVQESQNGSRGRKNSGSRRSQNKHK